MTLDEFFAEIEQFKISFIMSEYRAGAIRDTDGLCPICALAHASNRSAYLLIEEDNEFADQIGVRQLRLSDSDTQAIIAAADDMVDRAEQFGASPEQVREARRRLLALTTQEEA